jgi:hypothetical protein
VHRELGYSEPAAAERVNAMRLLKKAPEVRAMIERRELSLTTASQIHQFVKTAEKVQKVTFDTRELIQKCAGKSKREVEKVLVAISPLATMPNERIREISADHSELRLVLDRETVALLDEIKALLGAANQAETMKRSLKLALENLKKPRKPTPLAESADPLSRYIPKSWQRLLRKKAEDRCQYIGRKGRCNSTHRLQFDHIVPIAHGGLTELSNLRLLCQNHNLVEARRWGLQLPKTNTASLERSFFLHL